MLLCCFHFNLADGQKFIYGSAPYQSEHRRYFCGYGLRNFCNSNAMLYQPKYKQVSCRFEFGARYLRNHDKNEIDCRFYIFEAHFRAVNMMCTQLIIIIYYLELRNHFNLLKLERYAFKNVSKSFCVTIYYIDSSSMSMSIFEYRIFRNSIVDSIVVQTIICFLLSLCSSLHLSSFMYSGIYLH